LSRQKVLESIKRSQDKGYYGRFEEKPERKVYFAVPYNNIGNTKETIKRLLKGEKIIGRNGKEVYMVYGHAKLLGVIKVPATPSIKAFLQYIIYDVVLLVGKDKKYEYNVYHEAWIKLGEWVNKNYPRFDKEQVVFT